MWVLPLSTRYRVFVAFTMVSCLKELKIQLRNVLVCFPIANTKYLTPAIYRKKGFCWLVVPNVHSWL